MEDLDPEGVTDVAAKLRGQADRLDQVAADLADARADWAENAQVGRRDRSSSQRPGPRPRPSGQRRLLTPSGVTA
ncbi:hypothetical protein ACH4CD_22490 [Streptomyces fungicidicus]|uniref:hypothetical protein n=1 Tax=Streptomyces fungicidicus TaxID=68203 RepID=UPI00378E4A54